MQHLHICTKQSVIFLFFSNYHIASNKGAPVHILLPVFSCFRTWVHPHAPRADSTPGKFRTKGASSVPHKGRNRNLHVSPRRHNDGPSILTVICCLGLVHSVAMAGYGTANFVFMSKMKKSVLVESQELEGTVYQFRFWKRRVDGTELWCCMGCEGTKRSTSTKSTCDKRRSKKFILFITYDTMIIKAQFSVHSSLLQSNPVSNEIPPPTPPPQSIILEAVHFLILGCY